MPHLSRRTLLALAPVGAAIAALGPALQARAHTVSDHDRVLANMVAMLCGTPEVNTHPAAAQRLRRIHDVARSRLSAADGAGPDEVFAGLPLGSSEGNLSATCQRLAEVAMATRTPQVDSDLVDNAEVQAWVLEEIIDHCGRWAPAFRELLWYESDKKGSVWSGGSWLLQDSQLFISRHKTDGNTFAFAAKGGHNDEPHNHLDIGHFILFANGETYCKDLGAGVYSKDYFNEHRYSFLSNAARGHSIPQINSVEQGVGQAYKAEIVKHELTNSVDKWKLDMTRDRKSVV